MLCNKQPPNHSGVQQQQCTAYEHGVSWRCKHLGRWLADLGSLRLGWAAWPWADPQTARLWWSRRAQCVPALMTGVRGQAKIHEVLDPRLERATLSILPQSIPQSEVTGSPDLLHGERDTSEVRGTAVIQQRAWIQGGMKNWHCCGNLSHLY